MSADVRASAEAPSLRCRPIGEADLDDVTRLLTQGFPERSEHYWRQGLERHRSSPIPDGCPRFGFVLECDNRPVGVLLTLCASVTRNDRSFIRCNMSSWYVEPRFRTYAPLLDNVAMRRKDVTYFNISADPRTWPMQEARGFQRYCRGEMLAFPLLSPSLPGVRLRDANGNGPYDDLAEDERRILADHAGYGCVCLIGTDERGSEPFVFIRRPSESIRRRLGWSPISYFHLVYCRSTSELPRFAHAIGRHLIRRHAMPWIVVDAIEPIPNLKGWFIGEWGTKFTRGPTPMSLGDLAYTELVLFGP
jgi:hypothetical protein